MKNCLLEEKSSTIVDFSVDRHLNFCFVSFSWILKKVLVETKSSSIGTLKPEVMAYLKETSCITSFANEN